jgi:hypothetical protein
MTQAPVILEERGEEVMEGPALCSPDDLYRIMRNLAAEVVDTSLGVEELLAGEETERARSGKVIGFAPKYILRFATIPVSERGVAGKVTIAQAEVTVRYQYDELLRRLRLEQPGIEWHVVAARVRRHNLRRTIVAGTRGEPRIVPDDIPLVDLVRGKRVEPRRILREAADFRAHLELAIANLSGELQDPWQERTGQPSQFSEYMKAPDLRRLPPAYRREREKAEELIRTFYAAQASPTSAQPVEDLGGAQRTEWTEAQLATALQLKNELNYGWAEIAAVIGGSHQAVRAAVVKYASEIKAREEGAGAAS